MAREGQIGFGNLVISHKPDVVTLKLNTYHAGQPYALFTVREIDTLIRLLKDAKNSAKAESDDDWSDLV